VWVAATPDNAAQIVSALHEFGFDVPALVPDLFLSSSSVVRFGTPPFRIEVMTAIDGVEFDTCRQNATDVELDGLHVPVISLTDLKTNKRAAGRHKDLADLDNLP